MKELYEVYCENFSGDIIYKSPLYNNLNIALNDYNEKLQTFQNQLKKTSKIMLTKYIISPKKLENFAHLELKGIGKVFLERIKTDIIEGKRSEKLFDEYYDVLCCLVNEIFTYDENGNDYFNEKKLPDLIKLVTEIANKKDEIKKELLTNN
jgi:hypothetical protein